MDLEFRPVTADEVDEFTRVNWRAFHAAPPANVLEALREATELERTFAAFDRGQMVATAGTFTLELTVPGGAALPVGGLSFVGVLPSHRRRGILRRLMDLQLDEVAGRGEVASALTASESAIYGRFGYGTATFVAERELESARSAFRDPVEDDGRVVLVDAEAAGPLMASIHEEVRRARVGEVSRPPHLWRGLRAEQELEAGATEETPLLYAVHESAGGHPDGFAVYRLADDRWPSGIARGRVAVVELSAVSPVVHAALWRFLLDLDLVETVTTDLAPVDDPLRWRLADPRRLRTTAVVDMTWLRLLDVPAALAGRSYTVADALTFEVVDAFRPSLGGRFRLEADVQGGRCERTDAEPDLTLDAPALGSAYLGGVGVGVLAAAGRVVEHSPGAVGRVDALLRAATAPHCQTPF